MEELAVKLAEVESRAKSNTRRIEKLEQSTDALNDLTTAVKVMVTKQDYTAESIDRLDKKVDGIDNRIDCLELKPGKRWEGIVEKVVYTVVATVIGFLLAQIGM